MKQCARGDSKATRLYTVLDLFDNDHETAKNLRENHVVRLCRKELIKKLIFEPLKYTGGRKQSYAPERKAEMKVVKLLMTALVNTFLKKPGALEFNTVPIYIQRFCQGSSGNMDQLLILLANAVVVNTEKERSSSSSSSSSIIKNISPAVVVETTTKVLLPAAEAVKREDVGETAVLLTKVEKKEIKNIWIDTLTLSDPLFNETLNYESDESEDDSTSTSSSTCYSSSIFVSTSLTSSDCNNVSPIPAVTEKTVQQIVESMDDIVNCRVFSKQTFASSSKNSSPRPAAVSCPRPPILTPEELRIIESRVDEELTVRSRESGIGMPMRLSSANSKKTRIQVGERKVGGGTKESVIWNAKDAKQELGEAYELLPEDRYYQKHEWSVVEKYLRIFATELCFATISKPDRALTSNDIFKAHNHESKSNMLQFKKKCGVADALVPMRFKFQSFRRKGEKEAFKIRITHLLNAVFGFEKFYPNVPWGLPLTSQLPLDNIVLWLTDFLSYHTLVEGGTIAAATSPPNETHTIRTADTSSFSLHNAPPPPHAAAAAAAASTSAACMHSLRDLTVKNAICNISAYGFDDNRQNSIDTVDIDSLLNGAEAVQWIFDEEPAAVAISRIKDEAVHEMCQLSGVPSMEITRLLQSTLDSKLSMTDAAATTATTTSSAHNWDTSGRISVVSVESARKTECNDIGVKKEGNVAVVVVACRSADSPRRAKTLADLIKEHQPSLSAFVHPEVQLYSFIENIAVTKWGATRSIHCCHSPSNHSGALSGDSNDKESTAAAAAVAVITSASDAAASNDKLGHQSKRRRTESPPPPQQQQYRWTTQTEANVLLFLTYVDAYFNANNSIASSLDDNFFGED